MCTQNGNLKACTTACFTVRKEKQWRNFGVSAKKVNFLGKGLNTSVWEGEGVGEKWGKVFFSSSETIKNGEGDYECRVREAIQRLQESTICHWVTPQFYH